MKVHRTLHVDFNDQTEDGLIEVLFDVTGEYRLVDADGNTMRATLVDVDPARKLATLRPDWSTWRPFTPETPEHAQWIADNNAAIRQWAAELDQTRQDDAQ